MAKDLSSPADLKPAAEGTELQSLLGNIAERAQGGTDFLYTKFFAIGLFRLLELTGVSLLPEVSAVPVAVTRY